MTNTETLFKKNKHTHSEYIFSKLYATMLHHIYCDVDVSISLCHCVLELIYFHHLFFSHKELGDIPPLGQKCL